MDPQAEAKALADYAAAASSSMPPERSTSAKDEDDDIRSKFEYCKRAGDSVIVAGDPTPQTLPRIEKFVKQYDIRIAIHNHGPEDKLWPSPLDILKAIQDMDPRIGCCIDVGHTVRAGTDVVQAIHQRGTAALQYAHEGPDGFHRQGKPGCRWRRQDAGARDVRSADRDEVSGIRRSGIRSPRRRSRCPE